MTLLLTLTAAALAAPSSTPPGLDQVCDRYDEAELTGPEVTAAALESGRRGVPCDLTAEKGVCLYGSALVNPAPGASLATVPVERETIKGGETGTIYVATLGHFVDDWQGETAYLTLDDKTSWKLSSSDTETDVLLEITKSDDGTTGVLSTYIGGSLSEEAEADQDMVKALDGNPSLRVVSGTSTSDTGTTTSVWDVVIDDGKGSFTTLTTLSLTYTPVVTSFGSCWDGKQNGDEDGVDCGGSACTPCVGE